MSKQGRLVLSEEGVQRLRRGLEEHVLVGLQTHPAYALILASLLPANHRLVKAIGVYLPQGGRIAPHAHEETTTLWYPEGAKTPLVLDTQDGTEPEQFRFGPGEIFRIKPGVLHSVPEVTEPSGRLAVAVLSVPE